MAGIVRQNKKADRKEAVTRPTWGRFVWPLVAATLTQGRRTIADLLRPLGRLAPGDRTVDQRALSRAPWSGPRLGCAPARFILAFGGGRSAGRGRGVTFSDALASERLWLWSECVFPRVGGRC